MKITVEKQVTVKEELEVDDRIYSDHTLEWQMANILLDGYLGRIVDRDLYHNEAYVVEDTIKRINLTFKKVDDCLKLVKKFEIGVKE